MSEENITGEQGPKVYASVEEYFKSFRPDLVECLKRTGGFWPRIKNNTMPDDELNRIVQYGLETGDFNSSTWQASFSLRSARMNGLLPSPEPKSPSEGSE